VKALVGPENLIGARLVVWARLMLEVDAAKPVPSLSKRVRRLGEARSIEMEAPDGKLPDGNWMPDRLSLLVELVPAGVFEVADRLAETSGLG
jgi:hypothetical protein